MNINMLVEELLRVVRREPVDTLVGVYTALLQIRFLVRDYDIDLREEDLRSIIMPSVYSRIFQERAGSVYSESLKILSEFFTKHRELANSRVRLFFIESFEVKLRDVLYPCLPLYIRVNEVPEPWRKIVLKMAENVSKRLYPAHDQTQAGTMAIWEGDIMRETPSIYDLRIVERYLLSSNIALFGYNVYLVFPTYTISKYALSIAGLATPELTERPEKLDETQLMPRIMKALQSIVRGHVQVEEDAISVIIGRDQSRVRVVVCLPENLNRYRASGSLVMVITRSKSECPSEYNTICISTEEGFEKAIFKTLLFIKNLEDSILQLQA